MPEATDEHRRSLPRFSIKRKRVFMPLGGMLLVATTLLAGWAGYALIPGFGDWLHGMGDFAPWAFAIAFAVGTVLMAPSSVFNIAAGALFGFWWGMLWSIAGGFVGSVACFLIARTSARKWLEKKLSKVPRFEKLDEAVVSDGLGLIVLLRLSPLLPLSPVSYALGVSRTRFREFALSSPAMIPAMIPYVYTGDIAGTIVGVIRGDVSKPWWEWVILAAGLLATIGAAWLVTRRAKRALETRTSWA